MIDIPVRVKDALRDGRRRKNYRFNVLNDDNTVDFTIENDALVYESVSIDERMCSGDTIKFGLCEGSSLEFQYFNKPNITGRRLQAFIDVFYIGEVEVYINETELRQTQYTITENGDYKIISNTDGYSVTLLQGYDIQQLSPIEVDGKYVVDLPALTEEDRVSATWSGGISDTVYLQKKTLVEDETSYPITMGFFTVKHCSRQASTGIIKASCYNKLQSDYLDQKANLILQDTYTTDNTLTMFDIRYALLSDFKIIEDRKNVSPFTPHGIITSEQASLGSFKFNQLYGIESPINAYRFDIADTDTSFELVTSSRIRDFLVSSGNEKMMFDAIRGTLIGLEQNIVAFLKNLINNSGLNKTWDEVLDYICTNGGFQKIIGLSGNFYEGNVAVTYRYSTIQWEYEEAHGLAHTVKGKIIDAQKLGFFGLQSSVRIPNEIRLRTDVFKTIPYDGHYESPTTPDQYQYYADETLTTLNIADFPYAIFSDGTRYATGMDGSPSIVLFNYTDISDADLLTATPSTIPDFTLREIQTAVFETQCQFGQLSRETDLFSGVELNNARLLPQDTLYPDDALYPSGSAVDANKSMYSKLWADEGNIHKWRYLIITYKGLDENNNETEFTLQRTINADGTDDYNCSDNWLFRNLIWSAQDIGDYADAMVAKMQDVTWFPFEMWCAGLPYLETGDEIEIPLGEECYTSYILQRQLKGIQNLQDTYINGTLDIF